VINAGGLYVLGSERHESRRIDNQLRGRSGRQGDPGETRFYLSMDDNLMRIFASDRMKNVMAKLGMSGHAIESGMITRSIEGAQRRVEGLHFEIRKNLLEYDDIANEQRKIIYDQRNFLMTEPNVHQTVKAIMQSVVENAIQKYMPANAVEDQWDISSLERELASKYHINISIQEMLDKDRHIGPEEVRSSLINDALVGYESKQANFDQNVIDRIEKNVLLQVLDNQWREHLVAMDHLRQSVGLRGYAQKDPKQEYKRESFLLFESLLDNYQQEVVSVLLHYNMFSGDLLEQLEQNKREQAERERQQMQMQHQAPGSVFGQASENEQEANIVSIDKVHKPIRRDHPKIGRNDKCFCGSGNKYKHCHGMISNASTTD
jgi:preprotein translocase subunit SecA